MKNYYILSIALLLSACGGAGTYDITDHLATPNVEWASVPHVEPLIPDGLPTPTGNVGLTNYSPNTVWSVEYRDAQGLIATMQAPLQAGAIAALAVLAALVLLQASLLCRARCACGLYKALVPVTIGLSALVFVLLGACIAVGLFGADVCVDPNTTLRGLITSRFGTYTAASPTPTLGVAPASMVYYLQCGATPGLSTEGTALGQLEGLVATVYALTENTALLQAEAAANPSDYAWATVSVAKFPLRNAWLPQAANATYLTAYSADVNSTILWWKARSE